MAESKPPERPEWAHEYMRCAGGAISGYAMGVH